MDLDDITQRYLDNPNECPFCGSSEISGDNGDFGFDRATREVKC